MNWRHDAATGMLHVPPPQEAAQSSEMDLKLLAKLTAQMVAMT